MKHDTFTLNQLVGDIQSRYAAPETGRPGYQFRLFGKVGLNGAPGSLNPIIQDFLKDKASWGIAEHAALAQMEREALEDRDKRTALNALRLQTINNYVIAQPVFAGMFYEFVVLQENELPAFQFRTKHAVKVAYMGDNGQPNVTQIRGQEHQGGETIIPGYFIAPEEVEVRLRDPNTGMPVDSAREVYDQAFEVENRLDADAYTLANSGLRGFGPVYTASWNVTGPNYLRTFFPHPRVQTNNFPTTNILTGGLGDAAACKKVLDDIITYCESWGMAWGAKLAPTGEILMPSGQVTQFLKAMSINQEVGLVSQGIQRNYVSFEYAGYNWTLIGTETLSNSATPRLYPRLNMPIGQIFLKPSVDSMFNEINLVKNFERRAMSKWASMYIPAPWKPRGLVVDIS